MSTSGSVNAIARKSMYQRRKHATTTISSSATGKPRTMPAISGSSDFKPAKCPNCGCSPDVKSPCPATGKICSACQSIGHFRSMCRKNTTTQKSRSHIPSTSSKSLGLVKLQGATTSDSQCTVPVITHQYINSVHRFTHSGMDTNTCLLTTASYFVGLDL